MTSTQSDSGLLDFDEDGIEGRAAAHVGEAVGGQDVDVLTARRKFRPVQMSGDNTRGNFAVYGSREENLAARIEDADAVTVLDAARGGVGSADLESVRIFHLLDDGNIGK